MKNPVIRVRVKVWAHCAHTFSSRDLIQVNGPGRDNWYVWIQ